MREVKIGRIRSGSFVGIVCLVVTFLGVACGGVEGQAPIQPSTTTGPETPTEDETPSSTSPPTTSTTSPESTFCQPSQPECTGQLSAGTHLSDEFSVPFSYTVPDGWSKNLDVPTAFNLGTEAAVNGFFGMWPDFAAANPDACTRTPAEGVGRTAADIVGWLSAHSGLVTTEPMATTIGGFAGLGIELEGDLGWTNPCSDPAGEVDPHVFGAFSLLVATADDAGWIAIDDRSRAAVAILDIGDGHTLTVYLEADKSAFDSFREVALPVVRSFDFSP